MDSKERKISKNRKRRTAWNKGKKRTWEAGTPFKKGNIPWNKGKPRSPETKKKLSEKMKHIWKTVDQTDRNKKISNTLKGRPSGRKGQPVSDYHRESARKHWTGENNPNWKGGITPKNMKIRQSDSYKKWREAVFDRDDYTCQSCGIRSKKDKKVYLEAHHIKEFSEHPDLRFDLNNGLTLCSDCHNETKHLNQHNRTQN